MRNQRAEPLCSATLRFLSLDSPWPPPDDLLVHILSTRRPPLAEIVSLTTKGQLTPPFLYIDHTRTQRAMPAIYHPCPLTYPPASTFQC